MKLEIDNIQIKDCLTVGEFAKIVRERTGNPTIGNSTIHYHLTNNGDKLDYVDWCGLKMIVQNEKAKNFKPGNYYGEKRTMRKISL